MIIDWIIIIGGIIIALFLIGGLLMETFKKK